MTWRRSPDQSPRVHLPSIDDASLPLCSMKSTAVSSNTEAVTCGTCRRARAWATGALPHKLDRQLAELLANPTDGCVLWPYTKLHRNGYGIVSTDRHTRVFVHRASWERFHGRPVPDGLFVCHRCDVRACVNPAHLFLGTNAENVADMDAKGRRNPPRGEKAPRAKLTAPQVIAIRSRYAAGETNRSALAREYGISANAARAILLRRVWRHV